jgi:hypothetical protein
MAQEYASKQPSGFQNYIKNVAIVGAGGQSGKFTAEALLKAGKFQVTAITRVGSKSKLPDGVIAKEVNYESHESLVEGLKGQDCLVITLSVASPPETQNNLVKAAAEAKVPWVIPNEWGGDSSNKEAVKDTLIGLRKQVERDYIESLGGISWIGVACSFWYEYSLAAGPQSYGFDIKNQRAIFFDEGTARLNTTTWPQVGRAVANLLSLKVLPEDENDQSVVLSQWRNKFVRVSSFNVNQKEMFESLKRVTGTNDSDWTISYESSKERHVSGKAEMQKGNRLGFMKMLYSRLFYADEPNNFQASGGDDNEKLGLPTEELDEATNVAVQMEKDGYFEQLRSSNH